MLEFTRMNTLVIVFALFNLLKLMCCSDEPIEMAAMGRPFQLGMLYDATTESILPGRTLWKQEKLQGDYIDKFNQSYSSVSFHDSSSLKNRLGAIDFNIAVTVTAMEGTVEVTGSAGFLLKETETTEQSSIAMYYKSTSSFEQISMQTFDNPDYLNVLDDGYATHVVTAILYGNDAVLDFSRKDSTSDDTTTISGNLEVEVKNIPLVSVTANGELKLSFEEYDSVSDIEVSYYGDFIPDVNPTTYISAISMYKEIPTKIRDGSYTPVPVTVWLYPVSAMKDSTQQLVQSVDDQIINNAVDIINEMDETYAVCADYLNKVNGYANTYYSLYTYQQNIKLFKQMFLKKLTTILVAVRKGTKQSSDISVLNTERDSSYFSTAKIATALAKYETMISILTSFTSPISSLLVDSGEYIKELINTQSKYIISFEINSYFSTPWEDAMETYLDDKKRSILNDDELDNLILNFIEQKYKVGLFADFYEANRYKNISFVVYEYHDKVEDIGARIILTDSQFNRVTFEPLSKPVTLYWTTINANMYRIRWTAPTYGSVSSYDLYYRNLAGNNVDYWTLLTTVTAWSYVFFPSYAALYQFKVVAVGPDKYWQSPDSDFSESLFFNFGESMTCTVPTIEHGSPTITATTVDVITEVKFECDEGYEMENSEDYRELDSSTAKCLWDSKWDYVPSCKYSACSTPEYSYGEVERVTECADCPAGSYHVFHEVSLGCEKGYRNMEATKATCQSDYTWSAKADCKKIVCTSPHSEPDNGATNSDEDVGFEGTITYSCNTGYKLVGSNSGICNASSTVSTVGDFGDLPTCARNYCGWENWIGVSQDDSSCDQSTGSCVKASSIYTANVSLQISCTDSSHQSIELSDQAIKLTSTATCNEDTTWSPDSDHLGCFSNDEIQAFRDKLTAGETLDKLES